MAVTKESNPGVKNYITPGGLQRLRDELRFLLAKERPAVTQVVAWAASNGDRSENADYQYNKRRLRQIDRRIRFLTKRIDAAEVVDPEAARNGRAASHRATPSPRRALRAHPYGAVQRTTRRRGRAQATSSYRNPAAATADGSGVKGLRKSRSVSYRGYSRRIDQLGKRSEMTLLG